MSELKLQIVTPRRLVKEETVNSVTAPAADGEISVRPHHAKLLTVLSEGIVIIRKGNTEEELAIGGGYLETDGKTIRILVSHAYHQHEIDEQMTKKALEQAKKDMKEAKEVHDRQEAAALFRRSAFQLKLLGRVKPRRHPPQTQSM